MIRERHLPESVESAHNQHTLQDAEALKLHKDDEDLHWQMVNSSAGGYRLRWNSETTSKARIRELIAIHVYYPRMPSKQVIQ